MHSLVQPNSWVALKLPSGNIRVLQVAPYTTISLGKYGSFPSNLIIDRPYHLTYELRDRLESENFNRLRIVPASELYSDILNSADSIPDDTTSAAPEEQEDEAENEAIGAIEYSLVDPESGDVVARTDRAELDESARQTLSMDQIEELKKDGTDAGKALIAKLMLSHTAIDQKTQYSLAKYKLLKTQKYIRRFTVLPMDVPMLDHYLLEDKDPVKILDMREEMIALLGCWANVHFSEPDQKTGGPEGESEDGPRSIKEDSTQLSGRYLIIDDTGGLLTAAMAERMGILYAEETQGQAEVHGPPAVIEPESALIAPENMEVDGDKEAIATESDNVEPVRAETKESRPIGQKKYPSGDSRSNNDLAVPYASTNTLTLIHANSQPNLVFLKYYDFDVTSPTQSLSHPLAKHLMTLSWLQLLDPAADSTYNTEPPEVSVDELRTWKANRRGNYHRKRRRWARIKHIVDSSREGEFSGLVVASTVDPISIMQHTVPLLAGGACIAIYSQSIEPLTALIDCYSIARRAAWVSDPPKEIAGMTLEEQERWPGTEEYPLNPTLLLGAAIQTSRVRKWQVLPGRTHPLMTGKGGAEGYIFTAWRVKPAEGKVEARGKGRTSKKRKIAE